jgi:hypothetical protein
MIGNGMVFLQSSMDLLKVEAESCDYSEVIDVNVEEVTIKEEEVTIKEEEVTVKEEEDPLLVRLPLVGVEHGVSFMAAKSCFTNIQKCQVSS